MQPGNTAIESFSSATVPPSSANCKSHDDIGDLPIEVIHASERITMDDHAAKAARAKKESSMHVCARLVASGKADGFLSAGNTGRLHGDRQDGVRQGAGRRSARADRRLPHSQGNSGRRGRCRRECGLRTRDAAAVRAHGRDLFAAGAEDQAASRRLAFDRRRRAQRQRPHAGRHAAAQIARNQFHRQRGRPRSVLRATSM